VKERVRDLINLINRIYEVLHSDGDVVNKTVGAGRDDAG